MWTVRFSRRHFLLLALLTLSFLLNFLPVTYAANYTYVTIDAPDHCAGNTRAHGINDKGQIVGQFNDDTGKHGFFLDPAVRGSFRVTDYPNATDTVTYGINFNGALVGNWIDLNESHGFKLDLKTNAATNLNPNLPGAHTSLASGINKYGSVVGIYFDTTTERGYLYDPVTKMFTTIYYPNSWYSTAIEISDSGSIVGDYNDGMFHGYKYTNGTYTQINVPFTGNQGTLALGISSDSRSIVGIYFDAKWKIRGFLLTSGQYFQIDMLGAIETQARGVNVAGQIVGLYKDISGYHGFIATPPR